MTYIETGSAALFLFYFLWHVLSTMELQISQGSCKTSPALTLTVHACKCAGPVVGMQPLHLITITKVVFTCFLLLWQVYSWFLGCHKACVVIGVLGYGLLILEGIGLGLLLGPRWPDGVSLMLVWYGLYFGVLGRDLAEVAGDRMVRHVPIRLSNSHSALLNGSHCLWLAT